METGIRQNIKLTKLKQGHKTKLKQEHKTKLKQEHKTKLKGHKTKYNRDIKQNTTGT